MGISAVITATANLSKGLIGSFVGPGGCNIAVCDGCPVRERGERKLFPRYSPQQVVEQFRAAHIAAVCAAGDEPLYGSNWPYSKALFDGFAGKVHTSVITNGLQLIERLDGLGDIDTISVSLDRFRGDANLQRALANMKEVSRQGVKNLVCSTVIDGSDSIRFIRDKLLLRVAGIVSVYEVIPAIDFSRSGAIEKRIFDPLSVADELANLSMRAQSEYGIQMLLHDALKVLKQMHGVQVIAQPEGVDVLRYTAAGFGSANTRVLYDVSGDSYEGTIPFPEWVQQKIAEAKRQSG